MGVRLSVFFAAVLTILFTSQQSFSGQFVRGTLTRHSDGDTFHFQPVGLRIVALPSIRMVGTDAPEIAHPGKPGQPPWGDAAAKYLMQLVPVGTPIVLENTGVDKYKRILGRAFLEKNGQTVDVNLTMVRAGWSVPYIYCTGPDCDASYFEKHHVKDYLAACYAARKEGRGVFNPKNPLKELPYEFRLRLKKEQPSKWVGDFSTRRLYQPDQYRGIDVCLRVFFATREEGLRAGFTQ